MAIEGHGGGGGNNTMTTPASLGLPAAKWKDDTCTGNRMVAHWRRRMPRWCLAAGVGEDEVDLPACSTDLGEGDEATLHDAMALLGVDGFGRATMMPKQRRRPTCGVGASGDFSPFPPLTGGV
uniref:Uncharacterized protein n=1 Tax=Oryza glumipatula TaxID=40148 RepID=A0A0E0B2N9_9ORYZ